jgi:hypothetical protein
MNIKSLISLPVAAFTVLLFSSLVGSAQSILLSAGNFTLLGGTAISSTGTVGTTIINGNVGLSPGATTGITGFPPAVISGGGAIIATGPVTAQARLDLMKAANGLAGMPSNTNLSNVDMGGMTLTPGVYTFDGAATQNGALVLDAQGKNGVFWVFQIGTTLTTSVGSTVTVINPGTNGGSDDGIFWDAQSAITIGANNAIKGNYLAGTSITFGGTTSGEGRALALAGISLDDNSINSEGGPSGSDWTGGLTYAPGGNVPNAAVFPINPVDQAVLVGANVTFMVGTDVPATFQWQRQANGTLGFSNLTNTSPYSNVTTANLTVSNTTLAMSGDEFQALATSSGVTTVSSIATLTLPTPLITLQPANTTIRATTNVTFRVVATGPGLQTYVWKRNNIKINNGPRVKLATTATLALTYMVFGNAGNYSVVVSNANGSTTSQNAKLTVVPFNTPTP